MPVPSALVSLAERDARASVAEIGQWPTAGDCLLQSVYRRRKRHRRLERRLGEAEIRGGGGGEGQDNFIVTPPSRNNRSEHSGKQNSHRCNDGLKHCFLMFKA